MLTHAQIFLPFHGSIWLTAAIAMKDESVDLGIWDKLTKVVLEYSGVELRQMLPGP